MGMLTPNSKYIYESPDNGKTVYAREFGSTEKKLIGYMYDNKTEQDKKLFESILIEAENNEQLKTALENVKIIYYLSKQNES